MLLAHMRRVGSFVVGGTFDAGGRGRRADTGPGCADVHQGRRADLPGEVRSVPPARLDRADVARHLRRGAAVGALDQGARRRHADAAVAHRQDGRRAELQERSLAQRQGDRHDRQVGRCRRAAGQPEGHAAAEDVARGAGLELRGAVRTERAGHDRQVVRLHHAGRVAGRVGQARHAVGHHRAALGARHRDSSGDDQGPQDRASRDRLSRPDRSQRAGRRLRPADAVHGVGGRQAGRADAARHRQAAAAGIEVPLGHPLLAGR